MQAEHELKKAIPSGNDHVAWEKTLPWEKTLLLSIILVGL